MSLYSGSDNPLDHSIFKNQDKAFEQSDRLQKHFSSQQSGGGGGIASQSSASASSNSDNETEEESTESEAQLQEEEAEEPQEQLVSLSNARFITPDDAVIDGETDIEVTVEYLTDRTPQTIVFESSATYNGEVEAGAPVSGTIQDGIATVTVNLAMHQGFYNTEDKAEDDKVEYRFIAKCEDDETELAGDVVELPELPLTIDIIEAADKLFNTNSAIPCLDSDGLLVASIQKSLEHSNEWPDKEIVVYGHTDTSGDNSVNFPLSEKRAKALKALLSNDADLWNEAITGNSFVLDYQMILNCLTDSHGWNCFAGVADGVDGSNTQAGLKNFQGQYNENYAQSIGVDGIIGPQSWGAIMDTIFKVATTDYEYADAHLMFGHGEMGLYACGESFPIDAALKDEYTSSSNRRCEIGFHDRPNPPALIDHADPSTDVTLEECPVYDMSFCELHVIPLIGMEPISGFAFSF